MKALLAPCKLFTPSSEFTGRPPLQPARNALPVCPNKKKNAPLKKTNATCSLLLAWFSFERSSTAKTNLRADTVTTRSVQILSSAGRSLFSPPGSNSHVQPVTWRARSARFRNFSLTPSVACYPKTNLDYFKYPTYNLPPHPHPPSLSAVFPLIHAWLIWLQGQ